MHTNQLDIQPTQVAGYIQVAILHRKRIKLSKICLFLVMLFACSQNQKNYANNWDIYDIYGNLVENDFQADTIHSITEDQKIFSIDSSVLFTKKLIFSKPKLIEGYSTKKNSRLISNRLPIYDTETLQGGYLDGNGTLVIPTDYNYVGNFIGNYAVVGLGDTSGPPPYDLFYGVIDFDGNQLLECIYDDVLIIKSFDNFHFFVKRNGIQYLVHETDSRLGMRKIDEGISIIFSHKFNDKYLVYMQDNKYGFSDLFGKPVSDPIFSSVESILGTKAIVTDQHGSQKFFEIESGRIQDSNGAVLLIGQNEVITLIEDKFGVKDFFGNTLVAPIYDGITRIKEGLYITRTGDQYALLTPSGTVNEEYEYSTYMIDFGTTFIALKHADGQ